MQDCTRTLRARACEIALGGSNGGRGGALRQVSSLLTQAVMSAVGKVRPRGALFFQQ